MGSQQDRADEIRRELLRRELARRAAARDQNEPALVAAPPADAPGVVETAARGFSQGGSLGFGDEMSGVAGAIWAKAKGDPDTFGQLYSEYRDLVRAENANAKEAHGGVYTAGEIGGGIASMAVPGAVGMVAPRAAAAASAPARAIKAAADAAKTTRAAAAIRAGGAVAGGSALGGASAAGLSEADTAGGVALDAALGAGVGGVTGGAVSAAAPVAAKRLLPWAEARGRAIGQVLGGKTPAQVAPTVSAGERLEKEIGERLTTPQLTMAPGALGMQTTLARSADPRASSLLRDVSEKQAAALRRHLDASVDLLGGTRESAQAGDRVAQSYNRYVDGFQKRISDAVRPEFDAATKTGAVVPTARVAGVLDELIEANATELATETGKTAVASLQALRAKLGDTMTVSSLQNALRQWGQAARGSGLAIADTGDKAFERGISRRVLGALNKTLAEAAESPTIIGDATGEASAAAATALRSARQKYATLMAEQGKNDSEVLRRIVKSSAKLGQDASVEKILTSEASPLQIKHAVTVLGKADPLALRDFQTAALNSFLEKLTTPQRIATALSNKTSQRKIAALLGGGEKNKEIVRRLADALAYAQRITDQGINSGKSPTAINQWLQASLKDVPVLSGLGKEALALIAPLANEGKLAAALTSPKARGMLLQAVRPGARPSTIRSLAPRFAAAIAVEQKVFGGDDE